MGEIKEIIELIEKMSGIKFYLYQKMIIAALMTQDKIINKWNNKHVSIVNKYISVKGRYNEKY